MKKITNINDVKIGYKFKVKNLSIHHEPYASKVYIVNDVLKPNNLIIGKTDDHIAADYRSSNGIYSFDFHQIEFIDSGKEDYDIDSILKNLDKLENKVDPKKKWWKFKIFK